jgi:small subunit ribosomal protein S20
VIEIPNIRSAEKRLRQSEKRRRLNRSRKSAIKQVTKEIRLHLASQDKQAALSLLPRLNQAADKAAAHHTLHKNRASRIKARWAKRVKAL